MKARNTSTVSVVIPTHNSGKFIGDAVQSVLAQTRPCHEVIVIDDGSTDETQDVLQRFKGQIKYLYQEKQGPSAARNAGIKTAQGQYICFLDSDDLWSPNKIELQQSFMEQHSDIDFVFSDQDEFHGENILKESLLRKSSFYSEITSQVPIRDPIKKLLLENFIPTSSVMVRRDCFEKAGLFDEKLPLCNDRDMWLRIAAHCSIGCLPLLLGRKRAHKTNISNDSELALRSRIRVWNKIRRLSPQLTPASTFNHVASQTYIELGYRLIQRDQRREARRAGFRSLHHAIKHVLLRRSSDKVLPHYRWFLGIDLIVFSFIGWPITRTLWNARNRLFKGATSRPDSTR